MQKTTAQSQLESQKTRTPLVLFWKPFYKKKNMRAFNVARPRQRNIYQITSPTTCNLHAYRQASELRLNSFFYLDYFTFVRTANSPRLLCLAASWLVAWWFLRGELVGGETPWWRDDRIPWQGIETIKHTHIHIRYTSTSPLPENRKDENRKMWKLIDLKTVAAEISLINSVPVRIKFSRVLTLSKTRPSSDVWNCENAKT